MRDDDYYGFTPYVSSGCSSARPQMTSRFGSAGVHLTLLEDPQGVLGRDPCGYCVHAPVAGQVYASTSLPFGFCMAVPATVAAS